VVELIALLPLTASTKPDEPDAFSVLLYQATHAIDQVLAHVRTTIGSLGNQRNAARSTEFAVKSAAPWVLDWLLSEAQVSFTSAALLFTTLSNMLRVIARALSSHVGFRVTAVPVHAVLATLDRCVTLNPSGLMQSITSPTADHAFIASVLPLLPELHLTACEVLFELVRTYVTTHRESSLHRHSRDSLALASQCSNSIAPAPAIDLQGPLACSGAVPTVRSCKHSALAWID